MKEVVSDTGPLLHLNEAGFLGLLRQVGTVHIPPSVDAEIRYRLPQWQPPSWLMLDILTEPYVTEAISWQQAGLLDMGEAEALALARQIGASWFLTDDAAARLLVQSIGLEAHGSLGIVLWAAVAGHLDYGQAETALSQLAASSLWVSSSILKEAESALKDIFQK